jgi:hypothetical protein
LLVSLGKMGVDPTLHAPAAHLASLLACRDQVVKAWSPSAPHLEKMITQSVALLNSNLSSAVASSESRLKVGLQTIGALRKD